MLDFQNHSKSNQLSTYKFQLKQFWSIPFNKAGNNNENTKFFGQLKSSEMKESTKSARMSV